MVNYEEEYDKFEDIPNNIDYGSWYEYDNFQDFLDGKNAMDLTEGEEMDFLLLNLPNDSILDFNELRDDESIYREEYLDALIEKKLSENEAIEEYLKSLEDEEIDYEYIEKIIKEDDELYESLIKEYENIVSEYESNEEMILKSLIERHLLEEEDLFKESLKNESLENDIEEPIDDYDYDECDYDFYEDLEIEEKYYEHTQSLDELYWKMQGSNKENKDDEDFFNEITDYGDNQFEE